MTTIPALRPAPHHRRGLGLIDAMIAMAILAFGLLGMTRMQTQLVRQSTESQSRLTAAQLGDELLSTVLVDIGNVGCYTLPDAGACANANARVRVEEWNTRVLAALPGSVEATAALVADRFTVNLTWTGKESQESRTLEVTTDVRN